MAALENWVRIVVEDVKTRKGSDIDLATRTVIGWLPMAFPDASLDKVLEVVEQCWIE